MAAKSREVQKATKMNETAHEHVTENRTRIITGNLEVDIEDKAVCEIELVNG
jgi:hypothetical protein